MYILQQELVAAEDPQCDVRRPFMLVVNQTLGLQALGGLISQPLLDHNITNFRAMGGACVRAYFPACTRLYAPTEPSNPHIHCACLCMYIHTPTHRPLPHTSTTTPTTPTLGAGTGCFIVPLDGCAADELLDDPRIALTVPMEASMKKPVHFDERLNSTVAAIQVHISIYTMYIRMYVYYTHLPIVP